jgi:hypothetical protein
MAPRPCNSPHPAGYLFRPCDASLFAIASWPSVSTRRYQIFVRFSGDPRQRAWLRQCAGAAGQGQRKQFDSLRRELNLH